jgi:hypothetical protein
MPDFTADQRRDRGDEQCDQSRDPNMRGGAGPPAVAPPRKTSRALRRPKIVQFTSPSVRMFHNSLNHDDPPGVTLPGGSPGVKHPNKSAEF